MAANNIGVFLDRDGVINEEVGMLYRIDQLRLLPGVPEAIQLCNKYGSEVIVITNQPVIARGLCTERNMEGIHEALETMLNEKGAQLSEIYYCPHHENADLLKYRKTCSDRKPNIGMLKKASKRFNLDLQKCFVVGDRTVDILTGKNAGCQTILVKTGYGGRDAKYDVSPDYMCADLAEAMHLITIDLA